MKADFLSSGHMRSIEERFASAIGHLPREATYLAGISGGRDSVVLLHLLLRSGFQDVCVCHFDHGVREKTGLRDQEFTRELARVSELRFISDKALGVISKQSEGALRALRMGFFGRAAHENNAAGIFLGHHADDTAETILWNLLRGSGTQGMLGIQFTNIIETKHGKIMLHRPMLELWRAEINHYIEVHSLTFVEDETNRSPDFSRNRLRQEIIPFLEEKLGRNVRENLLRHATILEGENKFLDELAVVENWEEPLAVSTLVKMAPALQRRIILKWLRHHQVAEAGFDEVEQVRSLLEVGSGPSRANLSENRQVRRRAGKISLSQQSD